MFFIAMKFYHISDLFVATLIRRTSISHDKDGFAMTSIPTIQSSGSHSKFKILPPVHTSITTVPKPNKTKYHTILPVIMETSK